MPSSPSSATASPRGPRPLSALQTLPPASPSSIVSSPSVVGARDSALLRLVHEQNPFAAPHGSKGAVWERVAYAMRTSMGVNWQGLVCRNRMTVLLDKYDRQRAGKGASSVLTALDPDVAPILEETLLLVAKTRVEAQVKSKEKALVSASAALKNRDDKKAERERELEAKTRALMKERDEKRAAAVVAAAAQAREAVVNTATVVAKRRKRKGVKTKEQKRATAGMFEALQQSREEYMNKLRVETAAKAAAAEGADETVPLLVKKLPVRSTMDLDLNILRAVAKCSPFSQETKQETEEQWTAVSERMMKYCNLRFTTTAIRDRCEALIKDFEANDCKRSTFSSGVAVADEERISLLRVIRKAHGRHARSTVDRVLTSPEASQVDKEDSAIEIDDEQADENASRDDELEQWGSLEENQVEDGIEGDEPTERVEESLVEDTQDDEEPDPSDHQRGESDELEHDFTGPVISPPSTTPPTSLRKRRRSESGASPDADPAAGMDIEDLQIDDNSLDWSESQDFTPRKYKHQRQIATEQDGKSDEGEESGDADSTQEERMELVQTSSQVENSEQLATVIDLIKSERRERRAEFKAILDLVKQQNDDRRSEWEREHELRIQEQNERQQEVKSLVSLLSKERRDRKLEMQAVLEAMNKDRDDRHDEFKAMLALMTTMAKTGAPSSAP